VRLVAALSLWANGLLLRRRTVFQARRPAKRVLFTGSTATVSRRSRQVVEVLFRFPQVRVRHSIEW
jgi:hypothetical protein